MKADILIAGGGIAGLLLANELAGKADTILIERKDEIPKHKYWLTSKRSADAVPDLTQNIDTYYKCMDFIAYDDTTARLTGKFPLWDTHSLVEGLMKSALDRGCQILTAHRLYTMRYTKNHLVVRASKREIKCRLLIDCMGFRSPLMAAKGIVDIRGFYQLTGKTFELTQEVNPVGLQNPFLQGEPSFLELFPTSKMTAHLVMIKPTRHFKGNGSLSKDFRFVTEETRYSELLGESLGERLFGIVPVGSLRKRSLNRVLFFGESGQANPATSATGLTRMLHTFRPFASHILACLKHDSLTAHDLKPDQIPLMSPMNRLFQEELFSKLMNFDSDRFKDLVLEMADYDNDLVSDLIFAELEYNSGLAKRLAGKLLSVKRGIFTPTMIRAMIRYGFGLFRPSR